MINKLVKSKRYVDIKNIIDSGYDINVETKKLLQNYIKFYERQSNEKN